MGYYNIVGIDPGKNLGIAVYTIDDRDFRIGDVQTFIYYLDKGVYSDRITVEKLNYLSDIVFDILDVFRPISVAFEAAFKHRFANAVMQLSQYTGVIEREICNFDEYIKVFKYPPKVIKKTIGATGSADKDDMFKTVSKIPELKPFIRKDITEHEIDAMAIGYITHEHIKKFPECIFMNFQTYNKYI